ncbi:MAG: hypothetical protein KAH20_00795 [Methylococcales bacterium]|nr:hypothetical protein [Methylococcales bacterium]
MLEKGFGINASTTSSNRLDELVSIKVNPFLIDIKSLSENTPIFLKADILICNITVKKSGYFESLISEIEKSDITKVLFVSSTSVYGNINRVISEEDGVESIQNPLFKIESLFRKSRGFKTTIVRFGGLIGYSRNPGKFFSNGKIVKNSEANVNLIHRDDCIGIINQIIKQQAWGDVFNCCADTHPTKRQFYTHVSAKSGLSVPNFEISENKSYKVISNEKVKKVLNYKFLHGNLMDIVFTKS